LRLDILVPVATDFRNAEIQEEANKSKYCDVDIVVTNIEQGPVSIECDYDEAMAGKYIVELAEKMESEGADGIVLYCFAEPGLNACKEKLNIPVVGLREAAISMASLLGDNIGVIAPLDNTKQIFSRALGSKVKHFVSLDLPVLEYINQEKVEKAVETKIQQLIECGCDVVVFGCGSILGLDVIGMSRKYNVPVIEPIHAATAACNYFIQRKLLQSKIAFPCPPEKEIL